MKVLMVAAVVLSSIYLVVGATLLAALVNNQVQDFGLLMRLTVSTGLSLATVILCSISLAKSLKNER